MTDRPREHMDDESIAKCVRDLPAVKADAQFRDRLRSAFVSGEIDSAPADDRDARPTPARRSTSIRWWRWMLTAAAAAAVAVVAVMALNRGPVLRVLEATGDGYARVDGVPIALTDPGTIENSIYPGSSLSIGSGATLDLIADGVAIYEVVSGSRMTVPATPGRWFNRTAECSLLVGEIRMKTGPRFPGSRVRVYTPDGIVDVTGTLLSVQCDASGTCVCVLEGTVRVGVDEGDMEPVPTGNRKIMLKDGTVEIIPVKPMHRDGVLDFDRRHGSHMSPDAGP
jgi:ferric-dicitrate binding protein FerR (iron transport regulator)